MRSARNYDHVWATDRCLTSRANKTFEGLYLAERRCGFRALFSTFSVSSFSFVLSAFKIDPFVKRTESKWAGWELLKNRLHWRSVDDGNRLNTRRWIRFILWCMMFLELCMIVKVSFFMEKYIHTYILIYIYIHIYILWYLYIYTYNIHTIYTYFDIWLGYRRILENFFYIFPRSFLECNSL